jgi:hypothetical protein
MVFKSGTNIQMSLGLLGIENVLYILLVIPLNAVID